MHLLHRKSDRKDVWGHKYTMTILNDWNEKVKHSEARSFMREASPLQ